MNHFVGIQSFFLRVPFLLSTGKHVLRPCERKKWGIFSFFLGSYSVFDWMARVEDQPSRNTGIGKYSITFCGLVCERWYTSIDS